MLVESEGEGDDRHNNAKIGFGRNCNYNVEQNYHSDSHDIPAKNEIHHGGKTSNVRDPRVDHVNRLHPNVHTL